MNDALICSWRFFLSVAKEDLQKSHQPRGLVLTKDEGLMRYEEKPWWLMKENQFCKQI